MDQDSARAHLEFCQRQARPSSGSAHSETSSFVLSNVFAGCPLKVLCAASWRCQPRGADPCLYIIVGAETGLYVLETAGDRRELVLVSLWF